MCAGSGGTITAGTAVRKTAASPEVMLCDYSSAVCAWFLREASVVVALLWVAKRVSVCAEIMFCISLGVVQVVINNNNSCLRGGKM
jgi:hypothetical protein